MKIAIIGFGEMGHHIKEIAESRKHDVVTVDPRGNADFKEINEESMNGVNVAIDFTVPAVALENAGKLNALSVNTVMGTTGWYDQMDEIKGAVKDIGFIWSGNFSIGVNVFFRVLDNASKIFDSIEGYDVYAVEEHHKRKKDSPSGTAKMMADIILKNMKGKDKLVTERLDKPIAENELHFASVRGGYVPGTHKISFDSDADTIDLVHTARSRKGFAFGAVLAAEWINGKKGFFGIDSLMDELIGGN